jgi:hypothetical protein
MAKARMAEGGTVMLWCPACLHAHGYPTLGAPPAWTYNGDADRPTLTPPADIKVARPDGSLYRCHSVVTDGRISFSADSSHLLRGMTFELEDF